MKNEGYVSTVKDLAAVLGISPRRTADWIKREGFPRKARLGWPLAACIEYVRQVKAERAAKMSANDELRRKKLLLECELLQAKLDQIKGDLIPLTEHYSDLSTTAGIVNNVFEQWIQYVEAITRDPLLVQKARELENNMRAKLREKIEALKPQNERENEA